MMSDQERQSDLIRVVGALEDEVTGIGRVAALVDVAGDGLDPEHAVLLRRPSKRESDHFHPLKVSSEVGRDGTEWR
jgi:hypothetical protein